MRMKNQEKHINLIIMPIPVDKGMAGTTRLRNFIKFLPKEGMSVTNLILSDHDETYDFRGVTIMHRNVAGKGMAARAGYVLNILREMHKPGLKNVLLYYDIPHTPDLAWIVYKAKNKLGYTTMVDVVEDYNTQVLNLGIKGNLRLIFSGMVQKRLKWFADGAIGISSYLMEFLGKHFAGRPVVHLPVAFDPESIIQSPAGPPREKIKVFYGGTFGEKDGMEFLIEGFEQAASELDELELHLTGKASRIDLEKFEQLLEKSDLNGRIHNHGFVSYDEYCAILQQADILCMTRRNSRFANAGFPYKLGEFLATGKPVVVSRLREIENYLGEEACRYVTPESSEEIGNAILSLKDPEQRSLIGARGREVANEHFNAQKVGADLYNFIMELPGKE